MTEIIDLQRDVDTLLKLDTYQGMSDSEIDSVIAYKVETAVRDATISADMEVHLSMMRDLMESQRNAVASTEESLRKALDTYSELEVGEF